MLLACVYLQIMKWGRNMNGYSLVVHNVPVLIVWANYILLVAFIGKNYNKRYRYIISLIIIHFRNTYFNALFIKWKSLR